MTLIKHILVIFAMEQEAQPFIDKLKLSVLESPHHKFPMKLYQGELESIKITVATNGNCSRYNVANVGTVPAALTCYLAVTSLAPDLVINAGTAGGFKSKTAVVGDVFLSTKIKNHDRRIPIPGFSEYGIGEYTSISTQNLLKNFGTFKSGVVTTGNSLDHTEKDDEIMLSNDASVKDMEAAAIAWVCDTINVPFFAVKVITDIVDGDRLTQDEFLENLSTAAASLQDCLPKIINYISGVKTLEDL